MFDWQDPLRLHDELSEEERLIAKTAAQFGEAKLAPRIVEAYRNEASDRAVFAEMGELGLLGIALPPPHGGGGGYVGYGLAAREVERIDSAYRTMLSVQSSLVMHPIFAFGDEAQQERFLPQLAAGKKIGCFALTEPGAGSNPAEMSATAEEANGGYVVNGVKTWISNAPIADVFILWAKSAAHGGKTRGFVFERSEAKGMQTPAILGKLGMRASATGEAIFSQTWLPKEALLPKAEGIKAALSCLTRARFGICWGAMGAAEACWHVARDYGMQRRQFGKPIAQTQLFQQKLANMQTNIALGLCAALRLGRLMDSGKIMPEAVSMLKRNNAGAALAIARDARDMLGGNGMADSMPVMRHAQNLEAVNTYEGTQDMHSLILGRAQTGLSAF